MNIAPIMGMVGLAVLGLLLGWWLGNRSGESAVERLRGERETLMADRIRFQAHASLLGQQADVQKAELEQLRSHCAALATEIARAQEQLKAGQAALVNERELLTAMGKQLKDEFKLTANAVLEESNTQFLGLANRQFATKQEAIDALLNPVKETLGKLNQQTQQLEVKREGAYTEVLTEIKNIQRTHETLRMETTQLVQALRAPKARGNWGELQLKRCIEFAGMVERCSFDVEKHMKGNDVDPAQRPDVVVQLPNGRAIIIDAKTPLDAYLSAMSATDDIQRTIFLKAHATQVRTHLTQLGGKQYWQRLQTSPDFVVCFLPSEVLFSAALEQDPSLIEVGSQMNVILATPTTLIALLKAVAYGWQQMEITRNAIAICKAGEDLYKKLAGTQSYFTKLGNALNSSVKQFNDLVGAVEGRGSVFSLASKLHELKIGQDEIPEVLPIESTTRGLQSDHWDEPLALAAAEERQEE
ncbi:MAG: DNA recombination protein RmuC [Acidobacteriota bacterium]